MRAHILSERGRTAEGQDLLERVGQIDPEFEEARQLLATLEVHRLVLPELPVVKLPENLLTAFGVPIPEAISGHAKEALPESLERSEPSIPAESENAGQEGSQADNGSSPETGSIDDEGKLLSEDVVPVADVMESVTIPARSTEDLPEDPAATVFSTIAWAHDLIGRQQWMEARRVLSDVVSDASLDANEVDALLLEASGHMELSPDVWKLLGDHYMRTSRPQGAADAYFRATEGSDEGEG